MVVTSWMLQEIKLLNSLLMPPPPPLPPPLLLLLLLMLLIVTPTLSQSSKFYFDFCIVLQFLSMLILILILISDLFIIFIFSRDLYCMLSLVFFIFRFFSYLCWKFSVLQSIFGMGCGRERIFAFWYNTQWCLSNTMQLMRKCKRLN